MALSYPKSSRQHLPAGDWTSWAADHRPPARFLSVWSGRAVHGFDSPLRLGGAVFQPAEVVLGIRGWEDAFEDLLDLDESDRPVPYALFEIEKLVRMMLHQSGLAFEILASPAVLHDDDFPTRRIIDAAVTCDIVFHFRDVASGLLARLRETRGQGATGADVLDMARNALTGRALVDGQVAFDVWALADEYASGGFEALLRDVEGRDALEPELLDDVSEHVERLLDEVRPDEAKFPQSPQDYDWLNDFVVASRLGE